MPPIRDVKAHFIKEFLAGRKKLFKIEEVRFVSRIFGFKGLTIENLLTNFPQQNLARFYLPDVSSPSKYDKTYVVNVFLLGFKQFDPWVH